MSAPVFPSIQVGYYWRLQEDHFAGFIFFKNSKQFKKN
jgi:hypothetical protein